MSFRKIFIAATILAAPMVASAQPVTGTYVAAGAGVGFVTNNTLTVGSVSGALRQSSVGAALVGSMGYGFGNGLRLEGELLGQIANQKVNFAGITGKASNITNGLMINALYDLDIDLGVPVFPYLGVGVGYLGVQERKFTLTSGANSFRSANGVYGSSAVQGIVGLATPITDHLSATLEYRAVDKIQSHNVGGSVANGSTGNPASVKFGSSLDQSILVGFWRHQAVGSNGCRCA